MSLERLASWSGRRLAAVAVAWAVLVAAGILCAIAYATTAGERGRTPAVWPAASALPRARDRATIVMFVHPECPCTRASLDELNVIMNEDTHGAALVVAFAPIGDGDTASWATVGRMPRAVRFLDRDGAEAARFGAQTSGHVVVYDAAGALVFAGGITGSRGHAGDNVGRRQVLAALAGHGGEEHSVFGCALR